MGHLTDGQPRPWTRRRRDWPLRRADLAFVTAVSDNKAIRRSSGNFHLELARPAGIMVLHDILQNLMARLSLVASLYESRSVSCCGSNGHGAILAAIRRRDSAAARDLMLEYLQGIEASFDLEGGRDDKNS
ncbi:FCD domain-containing protein [Meridianimarinicoccus sp. RP-17]|uniref:FCD domain-containing protein n=1 Tax=Meridianimarinicoccus zhengii TaxID=2056810 RepID=UPI0013A6F487|nr:FCD domain-containing protein [Phycocomes zhengii]